MKLFLLVLTAAAILQAQRGGGNLANANGSSLRFTLGGKVATDDGSALPPRIAVMLTCSGERVGIVYTNAGGSFAFPQMSAASSDCAVAANQQGYRSSVVSASNAIVGGSPDVGTVLIHKVTETQGVTASATSEAAPKDAKKSFDKGMAAVKRAKPEEAGKEFEAAVQAYPKYADAWYQLGRVRLQAGSADGAREAFLKSMGADANLVGPQVELGLMAGQKHEWADSAKYLDRALQLDPDDYPAAWFADCVANYNLKKLDAAEAAGAEAQKRDTGHANPRIEYVLGMIRGDKGDYAAAKTAFEDYLRYAPKAADAERVKGLIASLPKEPGK